jgi:hypothetical protein
MPALVSFNGTDGSILVGGLIADAHGDLFGTTVFGGTNNGTVFDGDGTVFEIAKTAQLTAGILPWTFFSSGLSEASNSLINNQALISKVYFPRLIVPIATVVVAFVDGSPSRISGTPIIERTPPTLASPFFVQWVRPGIVDLRNFPAQSCTAHYCSLSRKNWRLLLDFSIDWVEIDTYRPAIYPVVQSEDASRVHPA